MALLVPEVRPLVSADSDRGRRRHAFSASMAGKGAELQPLQGPPVHFYAPQAFRKPHFALSSCISYVYII